MTTTAAILSAIGIALVILFVAGESAPLIARHGVAGFVLDARWAPRDELFGLWPMMVGSLCVVVGAMCLSTPIGLAAAVALVFFAPAGAARFLRAAVGVLAGIPSVVYGMWGLTVLVPLLNQVRPPGVSVLCGALVLALMIAPTMVLLSEAALRAVPADQLSAATALGLSRPAVACLVALPAARSGLIAATLLQVARAVGETMAVILVMGNTIQIPHGPFDAARALTAHIALEMSYALGDHRRGLFVAGLALLMAVVALVVGADRATVRGAR